MPQFLPQNYLFVLIGGFALLLIGLAVGIFLLRTQGLFTTRKRKKAQPTRRTTQPRPLTQPIGLGRIREIYQLLTNLTATLNYQRVLELALDTGIQAVSPPGEPDSQIAGAVLLFSQTDEGVSDLYVAAARRFTPPDLQQTFPAAKGLLREVVDEGGPMLASNPAQDPELGRIFGLHSCTSVYCIPLRQGIDTYGVILFAHPQEKFFNSSNREVLNLIAHQAVISIQNARLYQELEQEKERMLEIQEEARKKLARDLHDGPTQTIAAIAMRANYARRLMERNPNAVLQELTNMEDMARRTSQEIRHMLFTLRPLVLETQGLVAALEAMAEKMRDTYEQNVLLDISPQVVELLEMDQQGVIFYIVEEAVNNARKHAEAEHIWVRLRPIQDDLALLEIRDDGVGFDFKAVTASYEHRGSLGMVNLRERSELINGILHIDSAPGKGTRVQVAIPLTEEAVDRLRNSV